MKSLSDIKEDASVLYDQIRDRKIELKQAAEMNNTAGKYLTAEKLELAHKIFAENLRRNLGELLPDNKDLDAVRGPAERRAQS